MAGVGSATLDFGASPGQSMTSVAVAGIGAISAASYAEAFIMADTTADHTDGDHRVIGGYTELVCDPPTAGVGFTITAISQLRLTGTITCRWVWSD